MRRQTIIALVVLAAPILTSCAGQESPSGRGASTTASTTASTMPQATSQSTPDTQPYAGLQDRSIKALTKESVENLLAGRGAGYALAAELNHYPGPRHTLDLATQLALKPEQEEAARDTFKEMQQEAKLLGTQLVELETQLDKSFTSGNIDPDELSKLTQDIAAIEGRLRNVHLKAHLEIKAVLTPAQVELYDQLRGYTDGTDNTESEDAKPTQKSEHGQEHTSP